MTDGLNRENFDDIDPIAKGVIPLDDNVGYRHIDFLNQQQTPLSRGSDMTAKRFMEVKALLRNSESRGLKPRGAGIPCCAKGACCCDKTGPTQGCNCAHSNQKGEYTDVPFTHYVEGERREIGTAKIKIAPDGVIFAVGMIDDVVVADLVSMLGVGDISISFKKAVES